MRAICSTVDSWEVLHGHSIYGKGNNDGVRKFHLDVLNYSRTFQNWAWCRSGNPCGWESHYLMVKDIPIFESTSPVQSTASALTLTQIKLRDGPKEIPHIISQPITIRSIWQQWQGLVFHIVLFLKTLGRMDPWACSMPSNIAIWSVVSRTVCWKYHFYSIRCILHFQLLLLTIFWGR